MEDLINKNSNIFNSSSSSSSSSSSNKLKMTLIPTYKFISSESKWITLTDIEPEVITKQEITFITYNVWFERHNWTNRLEALAEQFQTYEPDFICLQEVTEDFLNFLFSQKFIRENYYISGNFRTGYDVIMLSKYQTKFVMKKFPSGMDRKLISAEIQYRNKNTNALESVMIATSHFESLNNAPIRKIQFDLSFNILNESKISFLMGDFNFDPSWKEQENININYKDAWQVHQAENKLDSEGFTMPKTSQFAAWRPDRIIYSESDKDLKVLKLISFKIIGNEKIVINNEERYSTVETPSDHYGLYAKFLLN